MYYLQVKMEKNSDRNGIKNVEFVNSKVEDFAKEFSSSWWKADTIVLDPPRDGLHPSAIPNIITFWAREIIYVSCNPATLVRDIAILLGKEMSHETTNTDATEWILWVAPDRDDEQFSQLQSKYRITDITPMDMFPHTHHIETVVRLERI